MPHGCPWMVPLFRWALLSGCMARPLSSDTRMPDIVTQNMTEGNLLSDHTHEAIIKCQTVDNGRLKTANPNQTNTRASSKICHKTRAKSEDNTRGSRNASALNQCAKNKYFSAASS